MQPTATEVTLIKNLIFLQRLVRIRASHHITTSSIWKKAKLNSTILSFRVFETSVEDITIS